MTTTEPSIQDVKAESKKEKKGAKLILSNPAEHTPKKRKAPAAGIPVGHSGSLFRFDN